MENNVTFAVITGISSGGFALLGVGLNSWWSGRREKAAFRVLELAGMERLIWGENWTELQAHLQRQQARMAIGGVPPDLIQIFHDISVACWRDLQATIELSAGEQRGIGTKLLEARELVHQAVRMCLLRDGWRRSRNTFGVEARMRALDAMGEHGLDVDCSARALVDL
jgi:hypothetical protein